MATEIYTPPQELPVTTVVYALATDTTGSTVYEDPNKGLFLGDALLVGFAPTVV